MSDSTVQAPFPTSTVASDRVDTLPALIRALPDIVFRMRRDGTYLDCSVPDGAVLVSSPAEFLGRRAVDVLTPDRAKQCMEAIERACVTGQLQNYEYSAGADADKRSYEVRIVPIGGDEVLAIVRNISDQKQAEAEARRFSQKLALHFNQTAVGVIEWDLGFRVVEWNAGAERIFGYSREHAVGRVGDELLVPDAARPYVLRVWQDLIEHRGGTRSSNQCVTADGRVIHCEWYNTTLVDESGKVVGVASLVQDVTQRVLAEQMLQREQRLFVSGPIIGVRWLPQRAWPVEFVTENIAQLGYTSAQFTTREIMYSEIVHPDDLPRIAEEVTRYIEAGVASFEQQYRVRSGSGEYRWIQDHTIVVRDSHGHVAHLDGYLIDATDRVLSEQKFRQSRAKYEQLLNTIEAIVWEGEPDAFRFTFMSQQADWILGIPAERFVREPGLWNTCIHPDDRDWVREYCAEQTRLGRDHQLEFRMIDADGSIVWFRDYVTIVADEHNKVRVRGIMVDITKLKFAETALARSREQLEQAQSVAHVGSWIWNFDQNNTLTWSHETFRIFGVRPEEFLGRVESFTRLVHPDDLMQVRQLSDAAIKGGARYCLDHRIIRPDRTVRWVHQEADIVWNADGTPLQMIGVVQDITDRRNALEALRQSEARFRRVVESNLIGLFFWDGRGFITDANSVFRNMLGFLPDDPLDGRIEWRELTPAEYRQADESAMAELRRTGSCRPYGKEFLRRDGSRIPVLVGAAFLDESRQNGVCFVLDITERKRAEHWQSLMMAELDHRVKNNMAAVMTLTEQTLRQGRTAGDQTPILLGRLRALSRTHGALAHTHWQGARLLPLVQQTLEAFRSSEFGNIFIEGEDVLLPARTATVLNMALHELATNALKYGSLSTAEGRVHISWVTAVRTNSERLLTIFWRESGGPPVRPPTRRGFGRELIEGGIEYECAGKVRLTFVPTGVECQMEVPLSDPTSPAIVVKPSDISSRRF